MAEEENTETIRPEFPTGRVKRIMKLDKDINKVNSEALFLVSYSAELFLHFLAEKSAEVATGKKRKIVKLEHMRVAVKRHQPTSEFLLDSLPMPSQPLDRPATDQNRTRPVSEKPLPAGTRRIDDFFHKPANEAPIQIDNDES
ncbi:DNA polymerase epsilon subunit 4 [Fagus crenata]